MQRSQEIACPTLWRVLSLENMDNKRIQQLADFFYGSDDSNSVPIRIMASTGMFGGFDFDKDGFTELLFILRDSVNLKDDLSKFREKYEDRD